MPLTLAMPYLEIPPFGPWDEEDKYYFSTNIDDERRPIEYEGEEEYYEHDYVEVKKKRKRERCTCFDPEEEYGEEEGYGDEF